MQVHTLFRFQVLLAFSMLTVSITSSAEYFFDQGLQSAVVRTEFNALNEGTVANPITIANSNPLYPCPDAMLIFSCVKSTYPVSNYYYGPTIYSQAFPWSFNGGSTANSFWVLNLNNENWWAHDSTTGIPTNPGAPGLSLPRVEPGTGIMGFKPIIWTEGGENFYRFHLVMNQTFSNPQGPGALPFMSIGAATNRGNGSVIGYMNDEYSPSKVTWNSKVWDVLESSEDTWASLHALFTTAEWGGKPRMLFVALYHESDLGNGLELHWSDAVNGSHSHWNWQIQESFLYPGADIAYIDAEDVNSLCGFSMTRLRNVGDTASYSVVLDDLYRCVSDLGLFDTPMPYTPVPITGVHWANEGTGSDIALWTSVHGMRMRLPPNPCPLCRSGSSTQISENVYPPVAAFANEISNEVTLVANRFRDSCKRSETCWEDNEQHLNGKRRKRVEDPDKFIGTIQEFRALIGDNR